MAARLFMRKKPCFSGVLFGRPSRTQCSNVGLECSNELETCDAQSNTAKPNRRFWSYCINEVRLLGYVSSDPKHYNDMKPFVQFTLATDNQYRIASGEVMKVVTRHNIIVLEPYLQNFVLKQLLKGSRIHISGRLMNKVLPATEMDKETSISKVCVCAVNIILLRKSSTKSGDVDPEELPETN